MALQNAKAVKHFASRLAFCGPEKIRTPCLLSANEALYQVSYGPSEGQSGSLLTFSLNAGTV